MDKFREAENNPFDAPVPGQSFTDKPGNYPWEHAPQYTDTSEAADYVWDRLSERVFGFAVGVEPARKTLIVILTKNSRFRYKHLILLFRTLPLVRNWRLLAILALPQYFIFFIKLL